MQTRSSSKLTCDQTSNPTSSTNPTPKGRIRRSSKQKVENSHFEEHLTPVATMTDNRTMAEMLRAPTEGCAEEIVVPPILAEQFELKHSLINMMTSEEFFGLEKDNSHDHIRWFNKITSTIKGAHLYYQCLAVGGNTFPEFQDNIQRYVSAAAGNYNQGNPCYRPPSVANQMRPPAQSNQNFHLNELEKIKRMNDVSLKAMQNQIDMVKNKLRNEMKTSIQTSLSNQTNEIKNMMASLLQMNTASTSGSGTLPGNTIANLKSELKAITTRSGLATEGPTFPNPPKSINLEEDECVEETYTDPDLAEYTIKVPPPPPVQKPKPPIQRNFVLHTRDSLPSHIPYPLRMLKQKQQEKDDIQIQKF
nr:hypothetical protein [Tanacetum cinerariifolium]